ncbi:uncharacterized protein BX664DRAFT_358993 [Halteromyces radiatus]|uniref:uncharacterized protein n=1 Tax=Halteromyces radiatus TaxID=101107 RepID=UPI0022202C78|nr:uncharacterized protein BX664DRAFT_358993 [Halteromyces radiatus]KAI8089438.1 hypothetical protein BX664DRAFT_358993 [Halteromyces radiatus]
MVERNSRQNLTCPPYLPSSSSPSSSTSPALIAGNKQHLQQSIPVEISDEFLPPYTCSVAKSGKMYIKREMDRHFLPSADRSWKKHLVQLHGTLVDIYTKTNTDTSSQKFIHRIKTNKEYVLLHRQSLQRVEVGWASDYQQHPYTFRMYFFKTGEQWLLRPCVDRGGSNEELRAMVEWIETIQAAITISVDLDHQKMPTFITLARTHYRHHNNMATLVLDQSKMPIQICHHRGTQFQSIPLSSNKRKRWIHHLKKMVILRRSI